MKNQKTTFLPCISMLILLGTGWEQWIALFLMMALCIAGIAVVVIQCKRIRIQKQQIRSANKLLGHGEEEKARIARELHDINGQLFLGIKVEIQAMNVTGQESKEVLLKKIDELGEMIRKISHRMNHAVGEHFTFPELVYGLCEDYRRQYRLPLELVISGELPAIPGETVLHLYRIMQEMIANISKHAAGCNSSVKIGYGGGNLSIDFQDDGPGFDLSTVGQKSIGIATIYERVKLLRGKCNLESSPGKGTLWRIVLPVKNIMVKVRDAT